MSLQTPGSGMKQCDDFMLFQVSLSFFNIKNYCDFHYFYFLHLQSALRQMRQIDDKIVYAINNSVPTVSFKGQIDASEKCQGLYREVGLLSNLLFN